MSVWQEELAENMCLVGARGRLDQSLNPQLEQTLTDLLAAGRANLVIDLSEATYINSGGLRCLVSAWRQARQQGGDLTLFGLNQRLQEIFSMVGFDKVFQIYPTRRAALSQPET